MKFFNLFLIAAIAGLCPSCVYFNTFYNAKSAFRQANESQQRRYESVSVDSVEAVTPEERVKFDRAIAKASKVLEVYPHKKKWADDAIFLIGKSYFQLQEYPKATRKFQELLANYPNSPFAGEAQVLLARSYLGRGDYEAAMENFAAFERKYPKHKENENIPIYKAQALAQMGTKSTAIAELNAVLADTPPQKADKTRLQLAQLNFESGHYEISCKFFAQIQDKNLSQSEAYQKGILYARCLLRLNQPEPALKVLEKMEKDDRQSVRLTEIWIEQGSALEALGKYEAARIKLEKAAKRKNPASPEAAFAFAELELKRFGRMAEAKTGYDQALQSRIPGTRTLAQDRTRSLSKIFEYEKLLADSFANPVQRKDSTAGPGQVKYGIGEIFWFQLDMADSAIHWFNSVLSDSVQDSAFTPKAALGLAIVLQDGRHDSLAADSLLRQILVRFPKAAEAKAAQKMLGMPITFESREDSAHNAYLEAEELLWKKDQAAKSADLLDSLAQRFPETIFGPQAAYTAAWIYDEVLQDSIGAHARYEKVYKNWKDSDFGRAASRKLKAGIDAEDQPAVREKKPVVPEADAEPAMEEMRPNSSPMPSKTPGSGN